MRTHHPCGRGRSPEHVTARFTAVKPVSGAHYRKSGKGTLRSIIHPDRRRTKPAERAGLKYGDYDRDQRSKHVLKFLIGRPVVRPRGMLVSLFVSMKTNAASIHVLRISARQTYGCARNSKSTDRKLPAHPAIDPAVQTMRFWRALATASLFEWTWSFS